MSEMKSNVAQAMSVNRRQAIGGAAAGVVATSIAMPAWAASSVGLNIYEGKYAIDSHKVIDGYFAVPRGGAKYDVLVVIPGENGIDDGVRDLVRRHARAGKVAIAPDLAKTTGKRLASRDAMIADFLADAPRLKRHMRGTGTVTIVSA